MFLYIFAFVIYLMVLLIYVDIVYSPALAVAEEFTYEIVYADQDSERNLDSAIALQLVRQQRDKQTGQMVLVFNIVYAPYKPMK